MMPTRLFRTLRRFCRDETGTGMVELALFAPVLALFTVSIVDLGMGLTKRMELHQAINRTLEKVAAREFEITDAEGNLDSAYIKADIVDATDLPIEQITVSAWLECDGEVQTPEAENFNGSCSTPTDILARYVEITIDHPFRPIFGNVIPVLADGTIALTAEAAVRIQ